MHTMNFYDRYTAFRDKDIARQVQSVTSPTVTRRSSGVTP